MNILKQIFALIFLTLSFANTSGQQNVNLQGYWEMVSQKINGTETLNLGKQIKLLTKTHFAWIRQNKQQMEELLAKGTLRDSLTALNAEFGAGTYKVSEDTYTETSEFFHDPKNIGTSIDFKFKVDGDKWYITGNYTGYENGEKIVELLEEEWKRVE